MPRPFLPLVALLAATATTACTDYTVGSSEMSAEAETAEITLAAGDAREITARLTADAEALAPTPNSWVEFTLFVVHVESTPIVTASAAAEVAEQQITGIQYMELMVDDPMSGCFAPSAEGLDTAVEADGSCVVTLPVSLGVVDGVVSLQLTAHFELNFGRENAPGTMEITLGE